MILLLNRQKFGGHKSVLRLKAVYNIHKILHTQTLVS